MNKVLKFTCQSCGKSFEFNYGTGKMATINDVLVRLPTADAAKLLEIVNTLMKGKTQEQRTSFMMNHADGLSFIEYSQCGDSIHLFNAKDIEEIAAHRPEAEKAAIEKSIAKFEEAMKFEGIFAFDALVFCRKCKSLQQGLYLKLHGITEGKEQAFVYANKCGKCGCNTTLVNDENVGYMAEGLPLRAPCPDCFSKMELSTVTFKP